MLKESEIIIPKKGCRRLKHFESVGYDISGDFIKVKITDLNTGSRVLVDVVCDYCNIEVEITYKEYKRNISNSNKYACSKKCGSLKAEETNLEKWGVRHAMCLKETQERVKETNLKRYGVEYLQQSDNIKERSKKTLKEKLGVDNFSKTNEFREKSKEWMLSKEFKEKSKKTLLNNFGVDNPFKSDIIKERIKKTKSEFDKDKLYNISKKIKKTKLERWNDENYNNIEKLKETISKFDDQKILEILEKRKKTKLERWNDESYNNPEKIKESLFKLDWGKITEKRRSTNLKRWGSENILKSEKFRKENFLISKEEGYLSYQNNSISRFKCDLKKEHEFEISSDNYYSRKRLNIPLCTVCNPIGDLKSIKEKELLEFIKSIYNGKIIKSYRDSLEIDIYLPDLNLGFEFNGLYYHSNKFKENNYHFYKNKYFFEKEIRIIHIWEDDWDYKRDILESQIKNWLKLIENKIFARKCEVREIKESKIATEFLNKNHIQGKVNSNLKLGLYHKDELVSLMTFNHYEGRNKMKTVDWNINRFCNIKGYNVIGAASKIFKYFINNYTTNRVISYSDNDWSLGDLYKNLGFKKVNESYPDYKYIFKGKRVHKSRFRKSKTGISESELELLKIYDSGKSKWEIFN